MRRLVVLAATAAGTVLGTGLARRADAWLADTAGVRAYRRAWDAAWARDYATAWDAEVARMRAGVWTSPAGVAHLIDDKGRCATCGRRHEAQGVDA